MTKEFPNTGEDFSGLNAAEKWIEEQEWSRGALESDAPTAIIKRPNVDIPKWRNLSAMERNEIDGTMNAPERSYRTGTVIVTMKD